MKLLRVGEKNKEIPAVLDKENKIRSLSNYINDFSPDNLNLSTIYEIKKLDFKSLPEINPNVRVGSCITRPGNFLAIGLNYKEHAEETGAKAPEFPVVFNKSVVITWSTF